MSKKSPRYRVKIQDEAVDELDRIYSFICEDSASRARSFLRALKSGIFSLRELPRRGTRVQLLEDETSPGEVRFLEHRGYLIFYTTDEKEVTVLHVTGPGQNWMRLFF